MQARTLLATAVLLVSLLRGTPPAQAQTARVVDLPTRPGVTERFLFLTPEKPRAAAILFAGGQGNVGIAADGSISGLAGNFLVRTREQFAANGIAVAVVDVPSDRRSAPYLSGFRQTAEHVADIRAVIGWLRAETHLPVWLIGTSRGTQSAAFVATELPPAAGGADGLVLTSTILVGSNARDRAVPAMPLARIAVPVLVVHHKLDGCALCPYGDVRGLISGLSRASRKEAIGVEGGTSDGDPCEAFAHHGFAGNESAVVATIADWIAR